MLVSTPTWVLNWKNKMAENLKCNLLFVLTHYLTAFSLTVLSNRLHFIGNSNEEMGIFLDRIQVAWVYAFLDSGTIPDTQFLRVKKVM